MASIVWNNGERSVVDALLGGQSNYLSPPIVPAVNGHWGVGLGCRVGGVGDGTHKADTITLIKEVGTAVAGGYGRAFIVRSQGPGTGWPAASVLAGTNVFASYGPNVTFTFTAGTHGGPEPGNVFSTVKGSLWFLAGSTTTNHDNALFGSDFAGGARYFGNGDTYIVTPAFAN